MKKLIAGLVLALIAPLAAIASFAAPAQAVEESFGNCEEHFAGISWDVESYSVYGSLASVRTRVKWRSCQSNLYWWKWRNNATEAVFSINGDNCGLYDGIKLNLSTIEGLDIDTVYLPCSQGVWTSKTRDLSSPGFTFEKKDWHVDAMNLMTGKGTLVLGGSVPANWREHGPDQWGGTADIPCC